MVGVFYSNHYFPLRLQLDWGVFSCIVCNFIWRKFNAGQGIFFFFFSQWMELYFLKINSKSGGSCLLVSENEHNKIKRQIWLVDMKFSSQKYLSGMKGKFGGSFSRNVCYFFMWKEVKEQWSLTPKVGY